ncbi:aspartate/tyrosine/aromatic aminotransferase [Sphingomonas sabuli]|uniref:Aspartate/tyrosine/aromatic aminotransferase n=1 Tax=Sphingomonas sabuli TaxID=2764186 RepID=A0A7G9L4F9_9SPHN|nr:aromatic amino acid transaminase [Sphingomonas sabuli]QNM83508.1 aspartate/tyrosine/aromatic aminotransferase [Sphingomonas sabuli]
MLDSETKPARTFADLEPVKSDSLLALIELARADTRPEKIDVGVGVYRDSDGNTPILRSVKQAEQRLWQDQTSKSYLGGRGDVRFTQLLRPIVLGAHDGDERIAGLQTPGGCGSLTLGFKLLEAGNPDARVFVGTPTWPNHVPIIRGTTLEIVEYPHYDRASRKLCFDRMAEALKSARAGDIALLHGCCHNPTGADLASDEWAEVARIVADRGIIPFVDFAYQGLGDGLEEDAAGFWRLLDATDTLVAAHSCDKNFGVYRDRLGTLWFKTPDKASTDIAMGHVLQISREMWSMPPDHAAAAIRILLDDAALTADWRAELDTMRGRIAALRDRLAAADSELAYIGGQKGMFSMLPLTPDQVVKLRTDHAIYMADSGRFNICGLSDDQVDRFAAAVLQVMHG